MKIWRFGHTHSGCAEINCFESTETSQLRMFDSFLSLTGGHSGLCDSGEDERARILYVSDTGHCRPFLDQEVCIHLTAEQMRDSRDGLCELSGNLSRSGHGRYQRKDFAVT